MTGAGGRFEELLRERIVVLDGAMGTMIQSKRLGAVDFGGPQYEGCNEALNLARPEVIRSIHAAYFEAGADVVKTNTFGGTPLVLAEYGLADRVVEINEQAARIAREVAAQFSGPRFVAGSMGPTTKAVSVTGGVTFEQLVEHYRAQAVGLLRGGVDLLLIETAQDTRNAKAGIIGIDLASGDVGIRVPLMLSATIETSGTMLAGQMIDAFYASVEHSGMISVGLNCATGPEFMTDRLRTLARIAGCCVSCHPNAGIPDENMLYPETPGSLAASLARFISSGWINIIGGCCGTTPDHIRELAVVAQRGQPRAVPVHCATHVSGVEYVACEESSRPLLVGERANVNGSRKFRRLIAEEKYEEAAEVARQQVKGGAQILDISTANPDRDELVDMERFLATVTRVVKAPLMIDSTDPRVIERALTYSQGKAIINSINLEDGESRFEDVVPLAHRYGAALVVGCLDEKGQAITTDAKLAVAERAYGLLTGKYRVRPQDIIWDPLVFPCASGDKNYLGSAGHTVRAVGVLKERFPFTRTLLGISNVSFGLPATGRETLNSVFLYHATKAGLDFAIVSSEMLVRYAGISEEERRLCDDVLFRAGDDTIAAFAAFYRGRKRVAVEVERQPLDERLARYVVEGTKDGLFADLDEKLRDTDPLDIINGPLMRGMDEVGRLFNNNELIVAEVLQSAEVMKAAVGHLEKHMGGAAGAARGTMVLATVKGDVHDIGKNLVDIILSNNGYSVVNLGIRVSPEALIEAVHKHRPDFIGLSGLLVKSAQQMVTTVEDFRAAGITTPVVVGGAALTKKFTYSRIRTAYGSAVVYAKDAMSGLDIANRLIDPGQRAEMERSIAAEAAPLELAARATAAPSTGVSTTRSRKIAEVPPRRPPTLARRIIEAQVAELWPYLNLQMLYGKHLGLRGSVERLAESGDAKYLELDAVVRDVKSRAEQGWMRARGVVQFFFANSEGNDLILYDEADQELARFTFPRQVEPEGLCISDYVAPAAAGRDSVAMFVVSCGLGIQPLALQLKERGEYVLSHALQSLALETTEAFAEKLHQQLRSEWGIADKPDITLRELFQSSYAGLRVSFGYPACPNLADQDTLWRLLKPEDIGVRLTEGFMMDPEASVSALVFHHPQARYFSVGEAASP
ncbi:MAG: methionine synthase [Acidobacteriota bacterium]